MSEERSVTAAPARRGAAGVTGAIILIAFGTVVLLSNLRVLTVDWLSLVRFWPVILVLIGLDIIVGRRSVFGSLAVAVIAAVVIGGIIWMVGVTRQWAAPASGEVVTTDVEEALRDVNALEVTLNLGVMETNVDALSGGDYAVQGTYKTSARDLKLDVNYEARGDTGVLTISQQDPDERFDLTSNMINKLDLGLTDQVPIDMTINAGVGEVKLDLTGINLRSLHVKAGVGSLDVTLPEKGDFAVSVDAGIGSVNLTVPRSLEARVEYDSGLSDLDIPSRFDNKGEKVWETDNYSSATNRVTIAVKSGIGDVNIHD